MIPLDKREMEDIFTSSNIPIILNEAIKNSLELHISLTVQITHLACFETMKHVQIKFGRIGII